MNELKYQLAKPIADADGAVTVQLTVAAEHLSAFKGRRHNIDSALRTMTYAVQGLQNGYRFDDERADGKIENMAEAVEILQGDFALLDAILVAITKGIL